MDKKPRKKGKIPTSKENKEGLIVSSQYRLNGNIARQGKKQYTWLEITHVNW